MKRKLTFLFSLTIALCSMSQIAFNGCRALPDSVTKTLLLSLPETVFGSPYTTEITFTDQDGIVEIDGKKLSNADSITFPIVDAEARYTVVLNDTAYALQFTFLPIIEIEGTIAKTYNIVTTNVWDPAGGHALGAAKVKFRGSSVNTNWVKKRGYHIKFVDAKGKKRNLELLGLRNDNSWILDGGTIDFVRIRNRVLTDLWLDMANKPYYSAVEPKARSGVRGGPVEVFCNGEYQGFYMLTEALDRKQMCLQKLDENTGAIHGVLYKSSLRSNETKMTTATAYDNTLETWGGFELKYPDLEDCTPTDWSVMWDAVNFVANAPDSVFADSIGAVLDMPVIIDYYVFLETTFAYDNMGKNMYWGCYDRNSSRMITPAVWDLDASLGGHHSTSVYHPSYLDPNVSLMDFSSNVDKYLSRLLALNPDGFKERARERYWALREKHLNLDSIMARFDAYLDILDRSGATAREQLCYSRHSDMNYHVLDLHAERDFIKQWLTQRFDYLDKTLFAYKVEGDLNGDGIVDVGDLNIIIDLILGIRPTTPDADFSGDGIIDIGDLNRLISIITNN